MHHHSGGAAIPGDPHRLEDSGIASSTTGGPDITFGLRGSSSLEHPADINSTVNTSQPLEESKDESKGPFMASSADKKTNSSAMTVSDQEAIAEEATKKDSESMVSWPASSEETKKELIVEQPISAGGLTRQGPKQLNDSSVA